MIYHRSIRTFAVALCCVSSIAAAADERIAIGLAKRDITPTQPLRLSGYGSRSEVMTGVRDRIFSRALVMGEGSERCVIVSIEGIAVTPSQTERLLTAAREKHTLDRARLVLCSTHSHTAPHPPDGLTNLFRTLPTQEQRREMQTYAEHVHTQTLACIEEAISNQQPGTLAIGSGEASFAAHRRVLKDGVWTGFGVTPDGPTDRRVQVLVARDSHGSLLGAVFQYACHCTTLGPDFNELTGDWAGLAAAELESENGGTVFLPVIGCGADANPEPRGEYEHAAQHGREMATAVATVLQDDSLSPIKSLPKARFGFAGLSSEQPTRASLNKLLEDPNVNRRRWAKNMLETWRDKGRLPESYPAPVHTWSFGKELAWVFLGGEVVVQYQIRLERELADYENVWVAAYTDDVFAYVAAEDMRDAGGYEVDFSMVYYNQPGRWQSGTEDLLVRRVHEILRAPAQDEVAKSPEDSLGCLRVPDGFEVELVASEPLVVDPVNLAFAADGSAWLVEMGDYPLGKNGGRVKRLRDTDGDGNLDHAETFLDGLEFPTSVLPWRDGAIVIAAPDVFFARDTDGDGAADEREVLLTGVGHANPQHRASGFEWGLDGWVYSGAGDDTTTLHSLRNDTKVDVAHSDVRWRPDTGELERLPGATQFVRSRDRWGRWFGNSNSVPLFTYPIDRVDLLRRNQNLQKTRLVLNPGVAPPVFPISRTVDRFNDLFAKNRFTSACGSIVLKDTTLGHDMQDVALVCEPVHNLVARFALSSHEASVRGERFEEDSESDWLASSDTWFRPVRAVEAPDGSVWVVDMYRRVIEHPQWIPEAWQDRLDGRAGETAGRIYRVSRSGAANDALPDLTAMNAEGLIKLLRSDRPLLRDLASQQLLWRTSPDLGPALRKVLTDAEADVRLQAFGLLCAAGLDTEADWHGILADSEPLVVAWAIRHAGRGNTKAIEPLIRYATWKVRETTPAVVKFELLLTLGSLEIARAKSALRELIPECAKTTWGLDAMSVASDGKVSTILNTLFDKLDVDSISESHWNRVQDCIASLWKRCTPQTRSAIVQSQLKNVDSVLTPMQWVVVLTAASADGDAAGGLNERDSALLATVVEKTRQAMLDPNEPLATRVRAAQLIGCALIRDEQQLKDLRVLLEPDQPGAIRRACLGSAYRVDSAETAQILIDAWDTLLPSERATAGATLLQRNEWISRLVESLERGRLRVEDLDASTINGLRNCRNYSIMKRFGTLSAAPSSSERKALLDQYVKEIDSGSAVEQAEAANVYRDNCAVCHEKRSQGDQTFDPIGPPLTNLKQWSTEQWVTAVLEPSANVEAKYKQFQVLTKSGQAFSGAVIGQSDEQIRIGLADSKQISIARREVEEVRASEISMMPQGLEKKITPAQLGGIIRYLKAR